MDEINPLQDCPEVSTVHNGNDLNKKGRPAMEKSVKFGPQPRSIVAQMLSEMKSKTDIIENESTNENEQSQECIETTRTKEHVCQICSHR